MFWPFNKPPKPVFHSKINGDITLTTAYGKKALRTGNITQSGGELVRMWEKIIGDVLKESFPVHTFLLLGLGGGMIMKVMKQLYPDARLTGVDIDPVMIQLAREHFDLQSDTTSEIITADAIDWTAKTRKTFDLIVIDLYIGALNAPKTRDHAFLLQLKRQLNPSGIVLYNSHYEKKKPEEYTALLTLCQSLFRSVDEVYSYPINRVLRLQK